MTKHLKERFPSIDEVLADAAQVCRDSQWDLHQVMDYLHARLADHYPMTAEELLHVLQISSQNEAEASERESIMDAYDRWEGRNNG